MIRKMDKKTTTEMDSTLNRLILDSIETKLVFIGKQFLS